MCYIYHIKTKKGDITMKNSNRFATNAGGVIPAPKSVKNSPKAKVNSGGKNGGDLRNAKGKGGK